MKKSIILENDGYVRLRSANYPDIELLREWKNKNKESFFYHKDISEAQQIQWFSSYIQKENDYMFIIEENVENKFEPIGCMGFRVQGDDIDLYNIIRGTKSRTSASMYEAMYIMLSYIRTIWNLPIKCDVIKDNPAVNWYLKCGFIILEEKGYLVMTINNEILDKMKIAINVITL